MRGRFAPSPSGILHIGNIATALLSWLDMRLRGGTFFLRIDDLDSTRCKKEFTDSNIRDLERLGIDWDGIYYQSNQSEMYQHYLSSLRQFDLIYACECSRSLSKRFDLNGVYLGHCRDRKIVEESHALRLKVGDTRIEFDDQILGRQNQNLATDVGDFIVKRRDGIIAYHLACAIDEHQLGITDIMRGVDLVASTPRQLFIMDILGFSRPQYAHTPLVIDEGGAKLSKRSRQSGMSVFDKKTAEEVIASIAKGVGLIKKEDRISAAELLAHVESSSLSASLSNIKNIRLT